MYPQQIAPPLSEFRTCTFCRRLVHEFRLRRSRVPGRRHEVQYRCVPACQQFTKACIINPERRDLETQIEDALLEANVEFFREHKIESYHVDFFIPALQLIIEGHSTTYHRPERRNRDHTKWDFLERRGFSRMATSRRYRGRLALITSRDVSVKVASVLRQRHLDLADLDRMDADYASQLAAAYEAVKANPFEVLPRPRKFRFDDDDYKKIAQYQQKLQAEANKGYDRSMRRKVRVKTSLGFAENVRMAASQPNLAQPPPKKYTPRQWDKLIEVRHETFPGTWIHPCPRPRGSKARTSENLALPPKK